MLSQIAEGKEYSEIEYLTSLILNSLESLQKHATVIDTPPGSIFKEEIIEREKSGKIRDFVSEII